LIFNGSHDTFQEAEVAVVETQPTRESPGPLDGIQLRAIGRQKVQAELGSLLVAPLPMEFGAMVLF
jgi:hypothetical protein